MWPAIFLLAIPIWHQLSGHRLLPRLRGRITGELVPLSLHEKKHRASSSVRRFANNAGWLVFLGLVFFLSTH